ncbi:MAG: putative MscS family protein YkuT [Candidatus Heimdallarchaeota archaeon LC_3]|nr:MAG: putative MscS family protein YkuT [Candidatus Heimdallarchaeota archaeon LC_3]
MQGLDSITVEAIKIVVLVLVIILIYLLQRILQLLVSRAIKRKRGIYLEDVINGIRVIIRLGAGIVLLLAIINIYGLPPQISLMVATIIGAVISFSSIQAIQNFVAGLFILVTRPFGIADLVSINGVEGIVSEISLNYTKLRTLDRTYRFIPNKNIINAIIINYNREMEKKKDPSSRLTNINSLKDIFSRNEVVRYSFQWGAPLGSLDDAKQKMNIVCKKYEPIFGFLPEFFLFSISHRMEFKFIVLTDSAEKILQYVHDFLDEIVIQFH